MPFPPASLRKSFDQLTRDELIAERNYWNETITWAQQRGISSVIAIKLRDACQAFLHRRFPEGSVAQPGTAAPDTPDLPDPNGVIIGPVSLRPHRVPVLETGDRNDASD